MSLIVGYDDLETIGFDGSGGEMFGYRNEPLTGTIVEYYPNNNLAAEICYVNGYRQGMTKTFYENGQIEEEYVMKHARFNGPYKHWDEEGTLILHVIYDDDGQEVQRIIG